MTEFALLKLCVYLLYILEFSTIVAFTLIIIVIIIFSKH